MATYLALKRALAGAEKKRYAAFLSMSALLALFVYLERGKLTYPHFWIIFVLTCIFGSLMSVVRHLSQEKDFNWLLTFLYIPLIYLLVYYSGGAESNLFPLFFFVLVRGALIDRYRGSFLGAFLVSILYGGFLLTTPAGSPERVEIIGRIVLLWAVAILFGNMGDRVKGAEEKIMAKNVQLEELIDELEKKNKELASLQEDLITAKRLEALNRVASMIIHDLKNAASQLSSLVQNMEKAYQDADFKEETISVISDTVEDMARMIGRLQNRPGRIELELVESDLNEVVKRAVRESGVRKNYGVTLVEDYNEMPLALIDERQMEKVLVNLIQNAAEAIGEKEAPGGGRLTLRSRWVSTVNGSGVVAVEVSDDGCGMSEDFIRNRLFKPFETTKPSGLGLGVYSCREIVRAHRGTIEAESRLGVGSTFVVRLPVANNHGQGTDSRG